MAHDDAVRFFVMIAGRPKQAGSRFGVVRAFTPAQAHRQMEADYRRAEGIAPNVFVQTERVHECDTEAEAVEFMRRLERALDEAASNA